jgi:hypothetical protein
MSITNVCIILAIILKNSYIIDKKKPDEIRYVKRTIFDFPGLSAVSPGIREMQKGQNSRASGNGKSREVKPTLDKHNFPPPFFPFPDSSDKMTSVLFSCP